MHELAIAESVVDIAVRHAAGRRVTRVELEVGHLRQVVPSALELAFELVARGTPVEGAELSMRKVSAAGRCRSCGADTELPGFPLACGSCGGFDVEVMRGEELRVESLEVEELQTESLRSGPRPLPAHDATTGG
jgi:hydrogenase nickel incorporation protein HypA/HybF